MAITLADFTKIWASTSPLTPYTFSESNYKEGWNFIGSTPPARQMWDSIQKQNDEKLKYIVDNFLPLSGGTMTGAIKGNPLTLTADDGNGNTSSLVLGADGSLALDGKSLSNVPDMSVFADWLNFTAPTVYSGRATSVEGGYKKIGNIVYVLMSFLPNNLSSAGRWTMFQDFPTAYNDTPMPFFADLGDNINSTKVSWINIATGGYLYMAINSAISNDTDPSHKIRIQGYYLVEQ